MLRLLLVLSLGGDEHPAGDRWFGADKMKHFFMAVFVQNMAYSAVRASGASHGASLTAATGITAGVSIGKELWDAKRGGVASGRDLLWDAAGAAAATTLLQRSVH